MRVRDNCTPVRRRTSRCAAALLKSAASAPQHGQHLRRGLVPRPGAPFAWQRARRPLGLDLVADAAHRVAVHAEHLGHLQGCSQLAVHQPGNG